MAEEQGRRNEAEKKRDGKNGRTLPALVDLEEGHEPGNASSPRN